jgi:filamentous hemagglutinin
MRQVVQANHAVGIKHVNTLTNSLGRGHANGDDTWYTNSQIKAGETVTLKSGNDTTIVGGVVQGKTVVADIKGDLLIASLQDSSSYDSRQQNIGGSATLGPGGGQVNVNYSRERMNSNYQSVTEQSGIKAGDGGFQVNVGGNTSLDGAVIASTQTAIDEKKNSFTTGGSLTITDIENKAEYRADSINLGGGVGWGNGGMNCITDSCHKQREEAKKKAYEEAVDKAKKDNKPAPTFEEFSQTYQAAKPTISPPGLYAANGNASSVTRGGISGVDGAGDSTVRSDIDTTNALKPIFNEQAIKDQFELAKALNKEASTFVANRMKEIDDAKAKYEKAKAAGADAATLAALYNAYLDAQNANAMFAPGGYGLLILSGITGAAGANVMGGMQQLVQGAAVNVLQGLGAQKIKDLAPLLGGEGSAAHTALHAILACAGAAAQGGDCGAGALGAGASVILSRLLGSLDEDATEEEKRNRINLITSLIAGIGAAAGDGQAAQIATNAAKLELENNGVTDAIIAKIGQLTNDMILAMTGSPRPYEKNWTHTLNEYKAIDDLYKGRPELEFEKELLNIYLSAIPDWVIINETTLASVIKGFDEFIIRAAIELTLKSGSSQIIPFGYPKLPIHILGALDGLKDKMDFSEKITKTYSLIFNRRLGQPVVQGFNQNFYNRVFGKPPHAWNRIPAWEIR